jgi:hypothetical protein
MIIKIYDRYTNEIYNIIEIDGLGKETLDKIKTEFKKYMSYRLENHLPTDSDNEELFAFIKGYGFEIRHIDIDDEIDL